MVPAKPTNADEVLDLLDAAFPAAALGAALELGLFWLLETRPLDGKEVARRLGIPAGRCRYWLQLLCSTGLINEGDDGLSPSSTARSAILDTQSRDSWKLLAIEARERLPGLSHLPLSLREPDSAWEAIGLKPRKYVDQMCEDAERARRFTRMLYELHQPLADELTERLDLGGVDGLLDLGGGSGVVSLALLRRYPRLRATVVDIANVCAAGREIAAEHSLEDRITYHAADFQRDELPSGFDMALECDVNVYSVPLFRRVRDSLNTGGRFLVVDQLAPADGVAPAARLHWAFEGSLRDPSFQFATATLIEDQLRKAGFRELAESALPSAPSSCSRFSGGMVLIEAHT
jgi:SAM-dependent methyltransferase